MDRFAFHTLNAAQRPSLVEGETMLCSEPGIRLYDGEQQAGFDNGELVVSSHRLLWIESSSARDRQALELPLSCVSHVAYKAGFLFASSPKVILHLYPLPPGEAGSRPKGPVAHSSETYVRLSFRQSSSSDTAHEFLERIEQACQDKAWEQKRGERPANLGDTATSVRTGILGLKRQKEAALQQGDQTIQAAFKGDLDDLMTKAKDMVSLAERYTQKLTKQADSVSDDEYAQLESYLQSLGIDNPVTRDKYKSGDAYTRELARQLAEFLLEPLNVSQGTLTMTDVYCLFNRARGTALVSPDDLFNACHLFEKLGLPMRLCEFDSGVLVVQSSSESNTVVVAKVMSLILDRADWLTPSEVARKLAIPLVLARQHLLTAEARGSLCRDDTVEGLRFYRNLFADGFPEVAVL